VETSKKQWRRAKSSGDEQKAGEQKTAGLSPAPTHFFVPVCFLNPLFTLSWSLEQANKSVLEKNV